MANFCVWVMVMSVSHSKSVDYFCKSRLFCESEKYFQSHLIVWVAGRILWVRPIFVSSQWTNLTSQFIIRVGVLLRISEIFLRETFLWMIIMMISIQKIISVSRLSIFGWINWLFINLLIYLSVYLSSDFSSLPMTIFFFPFLFRKIYGYTCYFCPCDL